MIAKETGMTPDDIISTLEALRFLVRDPFTRTYALRLDYDYMKDYVDKHEKKNTITLNEERLCWTPYVMGRPTNLFTIGEEATQPIQTVAAREGITELPEEPEEGVQQALKASEEPQSQNEEAHLESTETPDEAQVNGVSPKSRKKTPPTLALTPQPSFADKQSGSPGRRSPRKTPNGTQYTTREGSPTSFYSGSQPTSAGPIPPTRYEIFPPVPGMPSSAKRRPGRPSRRGRSSYGTPVRRSTTRNHTPGHLTPTTAGATVRRTRSKLGDIAVSVADEEAQAAAEAAGEEEESGNEGEGQEEAAEEDEIQYE
jgi:histone acetyltransferase SAS3